MFRIHHRDKPRMGGESTLALEFFTNSTQYKNGNIATLKCNTLNHTDI